MRRWAIYRDPPTVLEVQVGHGSAVLELMGDHGCATQVKA